MSTTGRDALLVVEHDFLSNHVGVRRVILHHWRRLEAAGYAVSLATPRDGELYLSHPLDRREVERSARRTRAADTPLWTSDKPASGLFARLRHRRQERAGAGLARMGDAPVEPRWRNRKCLVDDYAVSIVTSPWLCAAGLPDARYTAGIVYDMIPNMLAVGALNFGEAQDVVELARQHDVGNRFFLEQADHVLCISESTRADFIAFYGLADTRKIVTAIPLDSAELAEVGRTARRQPPGRRARVLLVNVLDPRKNFVGAAEALKRAAREVAFDVDIVGKERMPLGAVHRFLDGLASDGAAVRWYSSASDAKLEELYAEADVLLFPSFYEGLGLPIVEAQLHGVPVVTSDTSSCIEFNMNPDLCGPPRDHAGLARRVVAAIRDRGGLATGPALRERLIEHVARADTFDYPAPPPASANAPTASARARG